MCHAMRLCFNTFFNPLYSDGFFHISMGLPIVFFKGLQVFFVLNNNVFLSLKFVLILANGADPDEMQQYAAFYQGLHCLPKYPFRVSYIHRVKHT